MSHHAMFGIAALVGIPLVLIMMGRLGDLVPGLLFLGIAAFDIFVLPGIPGSPDACMAHHNDPCTGKTAWIFGLCFLIPGIVAVAYKEMRGDGRGTKGGRLP